MRWTISTGFFRWCLQMWQILTTKMWEKAKLPSSACIGVMVFSLLSLFQFAGFFDRISWGGFCSWIGVNECWDKQFFLQGWYTFWHTCTVNNGVSVGGMKCNHCSVCLMPWEQTKVLSEATHWDSTQYSRSSLLLLALVSENNIWFLGVYWLYLSNCQSPVFSFFFLSYFFFFTNF